MPPELEPAVRWLQDRATERGYRGVPLVGLALAGCGEAIGTARVGAMRRSAHAHTDADDALQGWICVAGHSMSRLVSPSGLPTALFRHEFAHLLAPRDNGHGPAWRRAVADLGAPGEARAAAARSADRKRRREEGSWGWSDGAGGTVFGSYDDYRAAMRARRSATRAG